MSKILVVGIIFGILSVISGLYTISSALNLSATGESNTGNTVITLVFFVLSTLCIQLGKKNAKRPGQTSSEDHDKKLQEFEDKSTPIDIVKTRYAKGEINKEQFDQMRTDLNE